MHYSTAFVSILAVANAAASRHRPDPSESLTVTLRADNIEQPFIFPEPVRRPISTRPIIDEPITEIELALGEDVQNEELRCQILDEQYEPIVVLRGNNTDITFADGGNGPWTLREPTVVKKIVCDSKFVKIEPDDERLQVRVLLQSQNPEVGISFELSGVVENSVKVREDTPIETVTLDITGDLVDPDLRCQIEGAEGPIVVLRGENVEFTFADGDGGPWTLQEETVVTTITCDPSFKKGDA